MLLCARQRKYRVLMNRLTNEARVGLTGGFVTFAGEVGASLFTPWKGYAPAFNSYISNPYTASGTSRRLAPVKQFNDNLSYIWSSHVWSFGASFTQVNLYTTALDTQVTPIVTFSVATNDPVNFGSTGIFDTVNFPNSTPTNRSDAAALYAALTGRISSISKNAVLGEQSKTYGPNATLDRNQQREFGIYFQDSWRVLSNFGGPVGRKALEGWQITSVTRIQSGSPYLLTSGRLTFNGSDSGVVLYNMTAAQLQDVRQIRKITNKDGIGAVYYLPETLVNNTLAAFEVGGKSLKDLDRTQPYIGPPSTPGQLGSRLYLYGPWQQKWDFSVVKHTRFGENRSVEFRAQILDAFNMTNFTLTAAGNPANSIAFNSSFGQTTNAYRDLSNTNDPGARMIEFVLRINF